MDTKQWFRKYNCLDFEVDYGYLLTGNKKQLQDEDFQKLIQKNLMRLEEKY